MVVLHVEPVGKARADDFRIESTCPAVRLGFTESMSEMTAETCGAAKLVPTTQAKPLSFSATVVPPSDVVTIFCLCGSGQFEIGTSPPGALKATSGPLL